MLSGRIPIQLMLWLGDTLPLPAPYDVTSALIHAEIADDAGGYSGFQLTFTLAKQKFGEFGLVRSGKLDPSTRIVIAIRMGVVPRVLIDGVITHTEVTPAGEAGVSTLTVTGRDISQMMDLEHKTATFENMSDSLIAARIIAQYSRYGLVAETIPVADLPLMVQRVPWQYHETDLSFLRRLAWRNGYVFRLQSVTFKENRALFGPATRFGVPQEPLRVDAGGGSNVRSLNFSNNSLASVSAKGTFLVPFTKLAVPIPQLPSLLLPPLSARPARPLLVRQLDGTANQSPAKAVATALSAVTLAPEAVSANGELDTVRYGAILRAGSTVGVGGAGRANDGVYFVRQVTHAIAVGEYRQSFTLSREGTGSLSPVV